MREEEDTSNFKVMWSVSKRQVVWDLKCNNKLLVGG